VYAGHAPARERPMAHGTAGSPCRWVGNKIRGSPHPRSLDRERRPVCDAGCRRPIAQPRQADQPAIVVRLLPTGLQRATDQPVCNELL